MTLPGVHVCGRRSATAVPTRGVMYDAKTTRISSLMYGIRLTLQQPAAGDMPPCHPPGAPSAYLTQLQQPITQAHTSTAATRHNTTGPHRTGCFHWVMIAVLRAAHIHPTLTCTNSTSVSGHGRPRLSRPPGDRRPAPGRPAEAAVVALQQRPPSAAVAAAAAWGPAAPGAGPATTAPRTAPR